MIFKVFKWVVAKVKCYMLLIIRIHSTTFIHMFFFMNFFILVRATVDVYPILEISAVRWKYMLGSYT